MNTEILSPELIARRDELKPIIQQGLATFKEVGLALKEYNESRLYLMEHASFEDYLKNELGFSKAQGYNLINAATVARNVSTVVDIKSERVARELSRVEPEEQIEAAKIITKIEHRTRKPVTAEAARKIVQGVHSQARGGLAAEVAICDLEPPEEDPNEKPRMSPVAKAAAQATISEWWTVNRTRLLTYPAVTPDNLVGNILNLFK